MRRFAPDSSRCRPPLSPISPRSLPPSHQSGLPHVSLWKSPLLWLALLMMLVVGAIPVIEWYRTVRVIAILASDVSDSGLTDPAIGQAICRTQTQALKPEDVAIDIPYADTTETTRSSTVQSVTHLFSRCQDTQQRPAAIGKGTGTSPLLLMERIQTQIQIQRQAGNTNPIAAVVWMQAAEPGPGLPPLDFEVLGQHIHQITGDRGRLAIIGPTGQLRQNLEKLSVENPRLQVCSAAEHQACIRDTFDAARILPAKN